MKVFIDTSAFIALAYSKDTNHREALLKQSKIFEERIPIFTSNAVIYETITWFAIKVGSKQARQFGERIWKPTSQVICLILTRDDELGTLKVLEKFPNVTLSFVDASDIYLIRKLHLDTIFSFDEHFVKAGLNVF